MNASRFAGMGASQGLFVKGSYFDGPGEYEVEIKEVLFKDTRKSGPAVIVELQVLVSTNPDVVPVGAKKSWVQPMRDKDVAFPNLLAFLGATLGFDPKIEAHVKIVNEQVKAYSEGLLEEMVTKGTAVGKRLHVSTRHHTCKPKGTTPGAVVTIYDFSPARG